MLPLLRQWTKSGKVREKGRARLRARTSLKGKERASQATAREARLAEAERAKAKAVERGTWHANGSRKESVRMPIASTSTSSRRTSEMSSSSPGSARGSLPVHRLPVLESVRATAGRTVDRAFTEMRVSTPTTRQEKARAAVPLPLPKAWEGAPAPGAAGSTNDPERGPGLPRAHRPDTP